jgi:hypothetical protein
LEQKSMKLKRCPQNLWNISWNRFLEGQGKDNKGEDYLNIRRIKMIRFY